MLRNVLGKGGNFSTSLFPLARKRLRDVRGREMSHLLLWRQPGADERLDALGGLLGVFVFPHSDGEPAGLGEFVVGVLVSALVRFDLVAPEIGVVLGPSAVDGTAVPEAAIDVDGDLGLAEDEVGLATLVGERFGVDSVAEPESEQRFAEGDLGLGVFGVGALHPDEGRRR